MVERRIELRRRRSRRKKMFKLKARLAAAKEPREREQVLQKIHAISPWWKESATPAPAPQTSPVSKGTVKGK